MRHIPGYPDPLALVTRPAVQATWRGAEHDVTGLDLNRELGSGLPGQVAGVDDMIAATGKVTMTAPALVGEDLTLPWGRTDLPDMGEALDLSAGLHTKTGRPVLAPMLKGKVDGPSGLASSGEIDVPLVDGTDRLRRSITIEPLYYQHPHPNETEPLLQIGLHPTYVTDRIARRCGFHATPPLLDRAVLSAPLMGSAWPERGQMWFADTADAGNPAGAPPYPLYASVPWGLAVKNLQCTWRPSFPTGTNGLLNEPFFVRFMAGPLRGSYSRVYARWAGVHAIAVSVSRERGIDVAVLDADGEDVTTGTPSRTSLALTDAEATNGVDVAVWISPDVGGYGSVQISVRDLTTGEGRTHTGRVYLSGTIRNAALELVHLYNPSAGTHMGGLQIGFNRTTFDLHRWDRTSIIETDPAGQLYAIPAVEDEECLALLKAQAKAELAALWIDEEGRFRYRSRDRVIAEPVSDELDLSGILDIGWGLDWSSTFEQVWVKWRRPRGGVSPQYKMSVWQGSGITLERDEVFEQILSPGDDQDWINLDPPRELYDDPNGLARFNRYHGSWVTGIIEYYDAIQDEEITSPADPNWYATYFEKLGAKTWLLRITASGIPFHAQLSLKTPGWKKLLQSRRGVNTPIIRARGLIRWTDETVNGRPLGKANVGSYEHDASWFIQSQATAQQVADWLAASTLTPSPVLTDVPVVPDARRQRGDVYRVHLGEKADGTPRPSLKVLVTGIRDKITSADGAVKHEQSLSLRVIQVEEA